MKSVFSKTPATRASISVSGKVQGVFFRANAARHARALGLVGTVENLDDGQVLAHAEGPRDRIDAFVEWCQDGPADAEVSGVSVRWDTAKGKFKGFSILR
jgi:acylphosphatase